MKTLYLVLSATPYKMGKFIRAMTHSPYNHISISLDKNLLELYSFARYYINTPFYGGFVHEEIDRFIYNQTISSIQVYEITITQAQYDKIKYLIDEIKSRSDSYQYNMASSLLYIFSKGIELDHCFNCLEFIVYLLKQINLLDQDLPLYAYTFQDIQTLFKNQLIFEGNLTHYIPIHTHTDITLHKLNLFHNLFYSFTSNIKLFKKVLVVLVCLIMNEI